MEIIERPYTPAEVEAAGGRSVFNQRNDRRDGYAPAVTGHARYDLQGVCRSFAFELFAKAGVPRHIIVTFVDQVAEEIRLRVMLMPWAWTKQALAASGVEPPPEPGDDLGGRVRKAVGLDKLFSLQSAQAMSLAMRFAPNRFKGLSATAGVMVWPTGDFEIGNAFWKAFGNLVPADDRAAGVFYGLHFHGAARLLVKQMPRPILDVSK